MDQVNDLLMARSSHVYTVDFQKEIARSQTGLHRHARHVDALEELQRRNRWSWFEIHLGIDVCKNWL